MPAHRTPKNLAGQVFGRLVVIERAPSATKNSRWLCCCECGKEIIVCRPDLTRETRGSVRSCGCLKADTNAERNHVHGQTGTPEYRSWRAMIARCEDESRNHSDRYVGRGIEIHPAWRESFVAFLADMGLKPSPRHEIDRIDNDKGYEPGNCRWATRKEQMRNQSRNRLIEFRGETKSVAEWAEIVGLSPFTIYSRLNRGFTSERALTTLARKTRGKGD